MKRTNQDRNGKMSATKMLLSAAGVALALSGAPAFAADPNLSGAWLIDPSATVAPPAKLTAAARKRLSEIEAKSSAGSAAYAAKWCTYVGMPQMYQTTKPINLLQNWREIAVISPSRAESRRIYLDPRIKPDPDVADPTTNGYTTARWNGGVLTADTSNFGADGVLVLPGGGLKSPKSKLREVIRLVDDDTLEIKSTWTDPTTLTAPHSYTQRFKRVKGQIWFGDDYCTPVKHMRAEGLRLPPGEGGSGE